MAEVGIGVRGFRFCAVLVSVSLISLAACAGPEPILKSNTRVQLYGKDQAEREVAVCAEKAERAGLQHGTNWSGNAGVGATLGVIGGAVVGASTGLIGGPAGVAIGAAAGGAVGGCWGFLLEPTNHCSRSLTTPPSLNVVSKKKGMSRSAGNEAVSVASTVQGRGRSKRETAGIVGHQALHTNRNPLQPITILRRRL